jgi:DNA-directed RNA polymerase subunit RPC12/RpoP
MATVPDDPHGSVSPPAAGAGEIRFPCSQCGAKLVFKPGTAALRCNYCGTENAIPDAGTEVRELDFRTRLAQLAEQAEQVESMTVKCSACGAEIDRPEHTTAFACPFCGSDIVTAAASRKRIRPRSLLPFGIPRHDARESIRQWLKRLWFAPNALKQYSRLDSRLNGMYVPHWTYDCRTISQYTGQRGDDYWTTESYTTTENGRTVRKTRRVRKTRWRPVSGIVHVPFDDVLVLASHSLPRKHTERLEPWDLENLVPYGDEYLSGFRAESYQVDLAQGFETAKAIMDEAIREAIRLDIGGDHQRIHSVSTRYDDITFKHILLPVWITAYRFKDKVYRVVVNARTGEVQGERPWSWVKITLFVLLLAIVAGVVVYLFRDVDVSTLSMGAWSSTVASWLPTLPAR